MVVSLKQVQDVTHATKATLPRFSWNEKKKLRRGLCWADAKLYPISFCQGEEGPSHFSSCPPSTWSLRLMSWGRITVSPESIQWLKVEGKYGVWDFLSNHWTFSVISHWMGNELRSSVSSVLCSLMQNSRNTFFNIQQKKRERERDSRGMKQPGCEKKTNKRKDYIGPTREASLLTSQLHLSAQYLMPEHVNYGWCL